MKLLFLFLAFVSVQTFAQTTATIPLDGKIVSKASDATSITPKWSVQSGSATIANPNSLNTTAVVPIGVTVFQLIGTDNFGTVSAPAYKKVTVYRNNIPPVMDAGKDTTIQLGSNAFVPNKLSSDLVLGDTIFFTYPLTSDLVYRAQPSYFIYKGQPIYLKDNMPAQTYQQDGLTIKIEDGK